jgi:hypothetical protein
LVVEIVDVLVLAVDDGIEPRHLGETSLRRYSPAPVSSGRRLSPNGRAMSSCDAPAISPDREWVPSGFDANEAQRRTSLRV